MTMKPIKVMPGLVVVGPTIFNATLVLMILIAAWFCYVRSECAV